MRRLLPFFSFYGSKHMMAPKYPSPLGEVIIEPFAGSAAYSLFHWNKEIRLYDKDSHICGLWQYLIKVRPEEILGLPDIAEHIDEHPQLTSEQKLLLGFWLNRAWTYPARKRSAWSKWPTKKTSTWGAAIRQRIASQLPSIRHWTIEQRSYETLPNVTATWFVDPPYFTRGHRYRCNSRAIDYEHLREWIGQRKGGVIVCENSEAEWIPLEEVGVLRGANKRRKSTEMMHTNLRDQQMRVF
jgi:site-specific DNA-adenine methylase